MIGPDKALDPKKYFVVATELFGNGKSSSPSNTPAPFDGPRFPVTSIRDNVAAVHRLLGDVLGVRHLRAVIGFSMGGEQAFQWAVTYPDFMDRIGSVKANAPAVKPAAVGQANATSPKARQSISLFQLVAGYNPARRVDVRSLPLVAA